jgi:hypothetical protein
MLQLLCLIVTVAAVFVVRFDDGADDSRLFYIVAAFLFAAFGSVCIAVGAAVRERGV